MWLLIPIPLATYYTRIFYIWLITQHVTSNTHYECMGFLLLWMGDWCICNVNGEIPQFYQKFVDGRFMNLQCKWGNSSESVL